MKREGEGLRKFSGGAYVGALATGERIAEIGSGAFGELGQASNDIRMLGGDVACFADVVIEVE